MVQLCITVFINSADIYIYIYIYICFIVHMLEDDIQSKSVARGPNLLSIKNYVIEIMT